MVPKAVLFNNFDRGALSRPGRRSITPTYLIYTPGRAGFLRFSSATENVRRDNATTRRFRDSHVKTETARPRDRVSG